MPNHVTNIINLTGDKQKIQEMLTSIQNDEYGVGSVDFNKIIPMPESLNIEAGSRTDSGLKAYREFVEVYNLGFNAEDSLKRLKNIPSESEQAFLRQRKDIKSDEWELGKIAWQNIQQYGSSTWYDWAVGHWGTKWGAYGYDEGIDYSENDNLRFQTAWSAPHPILEKLTAMFPAVSLEHSWADEDLGHNCGRYCYSGGERTEEYIPEQNTEALEYAAGVWDYDLSEMGYVKSKTGTGYINIENEDFEKIELLGKPALFTNERLTDADIPQGLYCYHLRESDDGDGFCTIEPKVGVNHGGSVITNEPIDFGRDGYLSFTNDTSLNFIGEQQTLSEYLSDSDPQESEVMKLC